MKVNVLKIIFQNEDNGYMIMKVNEQGTENRLTVKGYFTDVTEGSEISVDGSITNNPKYGKEMTVTSWMPLMPSTKEGIIAYLCSGLIKGIGPVLAERMYNHFKKQLISILDNNPERIIEVPGIGLQKQEQIISSWKENTEMRDTMMFLQSHGVSAAYAVRIYKRYKDKSIETISENPYKLADDIDGIGFLKADSIALKLGIAKDSEERITSGLQYVLESATNEGNVYLEIDELILRTSRLLDLKDGIQEVLQKLISSKEVICETTENIVAVYNKEMFFAEKKVSEKLLKLMDPNRKLAYVPSDTSATVKATGKVYDDCQLAAIRMASSGILVLTGGPGTGKTTTVQGLITQYELSGLEVKLAAPTGKAAKRMSEATGRYASTIHRLLEYMPGGGFNRDSTNPLKGDVLIIDEASMVDILLMRNLVEAIPDEMRLVIVGDVNQLPSVGPGAVLKDVIASGVIPTVALTKIFRQAEESGIITNAHKINRGEKISANSTDFFFMPRDTNNIKATIGELIKTKLPNYYKVDPYEIQVLAPKRKGSTGIEELNAFLQTELNPKPKHKLTKGFKTFCTGDKVMQIKNDYDKAVFNGYIGIIESVNEGDRSLKVKFDDRILKYEGLDLDNLELAYATTIHKSQGSEYPIVILPMLREYNIMLQRNLLYTAVTRAKNIVIVIGDNSAVGMAIKNNASIKRNTLLVERLKKIV